jgi:hypothetical protein
MPQAPLAGGRASSTVAAAAVPAGGGSLALFGNAALVHFGGAFEVGADAMPAADVDSATAPMAMPPVARTAETAPPIANVPTPEPVPTTPAEPPPFPLLAETVKPPHDLVDTAPLPAPSRMIDGMPLWTQALNSLASWVCTASLACSAASTVTVAYCRGVRRSGRRREGAIALPNITGPRDLM